MAQPATCNNILNYKCLSDLWSLAGKQRSRALNKKRVLIVIFMMRSWSAVEWAMQFNWIIRDWFMIWCSAFDLFDHIPLLYFRSFHLWLICVCFVSPSPVFRSIAVCQLEESVKLIRSNTLVPFTRVPVAIETTTMVVGKRETSDN